MSLREVDVTEQIRDQLGQYGLAEIASHLWPVDCQTCGAALADQAPSLCVDLIPGVGSGMATLHHSACRYPVWNDSGSRSVTKEHYLSYRTQTFIMPTNPPGEDKVVMLVHPGLEMVSINKYDDQWRVSTVDHYRYYGFGLAGTKECIVDLPVPNTTLKMGADDLQVTVLANRWSGNIVPEMAQLIYKTGGILVAISSAMLPSDLRVMGDFFDIIQRKQVAMGWIALS